MDITVFFKFPGILITVGVVLLILSIVLLILAFKTSDEVVVDDKSNDFIDKTEEKSLEMKTDNKGKLNKKSEKSGSNLKDSEDELASTKVFETSDNKKVVEEEVKSEDNAVNDIETPDKDSNQDDDVELL